MPLSNSLSTPLLPKPRRTSRAWLPMRMATLVLSIVALALAAHAEIVKGPFTFADDAFVDQLLGQGGTVSALPPGDLATAITDTSVATGVFLRSPGAFIELAFTDNLVQNSGGTDLVIFEFFAPTSSDLTIEIGGTTQTVVGGPIFSEDGQNTNAVQINLTDFGFAAGATISTLRIARPIGTSAGPVIGAVAALNTIGLDLDVEVLIRPDDDPNPVNVFGNTTIPVALLGSATFDVEDVDATTLAFGPAGAATRHNLDDPVTFANHLADVDLDGFTDLVMHYRTQGTGIAFGDVEACLTGETLGALGFEGCDSVVTQPNCGIGFELVFVLPPLIWLRRHRRRAHR